MRDTRYHAEKSDTSHSPNPKLLNVDPLPDWVFNLLLPIVFWAIAFSLMPIATAFQFDTDEGQELVKAILYNQGYTLFEEIWSDQPPLLTLVLGSWLQWWGNSVLAARLFILGLSTILVWTFAQLLRRTVGDRYAVLGALLLLWTANFLRMSVSVMVGMPAVALMMLSLYCLVRHNETATHSRGFRIWLVLAGICTAISLHIKMFTILLLPLWGLYLGVGSLQGSSGRSHRAVLDLGIWGISIIIAFLGISIPFGPEYLNIVFVFHVQSDVKSAFVQEHSLRDVALFYLQELDYVCLMLFGLTTAIPIRVGNRFKPSYASLLRTPLTVLPIAWLVWVTLFLINHKPIWYHHHLLIAIPLTWLATVGLKAAEQRLQQQRIWELLRQYHWSQVLKPAVLVVGFLAIAIPVKLTALHLHNQAILHESQEQWQVIHQIQAEADGNPWLFTDIPIYGVYAQRLIPPEIATLSRKRIAAKDFSPELLRTLIQKYDLHQFIIGRFPQVEDFLNQSLPAQLRKHDYPAARYYYRD